MILEKLNLKLFDGEGEVGEQSADTTPREGDLSNVRFGKQSETEVVVEDSPAKSETEVSVTSNTLESRRKAYDDFINGEGKEFYTQDTQKMINRRFKETKELESKVKDQQSLIDILSQKYGESDYAKLKAAIEDDDTMWQDAADDAGMTVSQYKEFQRMQRENKALIAEKEKAAQEEKIKQQVQVWTQEEALLKEKVPSFDLRTEYENPQFRAMLQSGVPMEHAYKVIHFEEVMNDAVNQAQIATEKKVVDSVRAKGIRPVENGTISQSPFLVKDDVSKLSKEDRAEIARRVARGETISF